MPAMLATRIGPQWTVWLWLLVILGGACAVAVGAGALAALSGELALIAVVVGLSSLWILFKPIVGVWLLCLLMPLSQTKVVPRQLLGITGLSPTNVLLVSTAAAILVAWFFARMSSRPASLPPLPRPLVILYLLPITLAALAGAGSVELIPDYFRQIGAVAFDSPQAYLRDIYLRPMLIVLFALLVAMMFRDHRDPRSLLLASLIGGLAICGLIVTVVILLGGNLAQLGSTSSRSFLSGLGMHANEFSLMLNSVLAVLLFCLRGASGPLRLLLAASAALLTACVLLTFSRGGYLGLILVFTLYVAHARNWRQMGFAVLLGAVLLLLVPDAVIERATHGMADRDISSITAGRADAIWPLLLPVIADSPLFGNGLMSLLWSEPARRGLLSVAQPHNAYLGLVLDFGLIGALLILSFFAWAWWSMRCAARDSVEPFYRQFFLGASVTVPLLLAQALSDDRFTPTATQTFMWLCIGAAIGWRARQRAARAQVAEGAR
jgi:O-antigen ligase